MPALQPSLIDVRAGKLAGALAADKSRCCLRGWLARVPDPRSRLGRWHPLVFVLALAVCAFTAAGHDSPEAVAEWAACCSQATLAALGGRRDPWAGRIRPPSVRTFSRIFGRIDAEAFNAAVCGYLAALPPRPAEELPEVTRHEREQRRAARAAAADGIAWPYASAAAGWLTGAATDPAARIHVPGQHIPQLLRVPGVQIDLILGAVQPEANCPLGGAAVEITRHAAAGDTATGGDVTLACLEKDDALFGRPSRQQPQRVLVEAVRTSEVANAKGDSRDTRFHPDSCEQPTVTQVSRAHQTSGSGRALVSDPVRRNPPRTAVRVCAGIAVSDPRGASALAAGIGRCANSAWPQSPSGGAHGRRGLPGGTREIRGDDVRGVPVQAAAGPVVLHRGSRIGVRGGLLYVTQGGPGIERGGDEGVPERMGRDGFRDPGAAGGLADDPPGPVPVQPLPVGGQEHRPAGALADGQVDRPGGPRRQRDGDHLAALAGDGQGPVPAFQAQVLDIGAGGL